MYAGAQATGNGVTDRLADLETRDPYAPSHLAAESTVTGLRTDARVLVHIAQQA